MKYTITIEDAKKRLDKFLTEKMSDFSRSQIQKMIRKGEVTVNGKKVTPHNFLKNNDVIEIQKGKSLSAIAAGLTGAAKADKRLPKFRVVAETKDYLVIEKPSGVVTHGASGITEPTLVDAIVKKYPEIEKIYDKKDKGSKNRPGIVHRLDKDASGLMVVAKNTRSLNNLKNNFKTER